MTATEEVSQRPFTAASFNQFLSEEKLMASHCTACKKLYLPPRAICPHCHSANLQWKKLTGKGKLATFTLVSITSTMMEEEGYGRENPNCTGIVRLEEGVKISARIRGVDTSHPESIQVGVNLKVDYLHRGEDDERRTYLAFEPE